jgi:queuine tRNA-ribosyltransferase
MNSNKNISPIFEDCQSSCLTNQDLILAGVTTISLNLKNLLIRPGKDFLQNTPDIRKFFAWEKGVVLNCSSLEPNAQNMFNIISEIDGSKFIFSSGEILELIQNLFVDMIVYPQIVYTKTDNTKQEMAVFQQQNYHNDDDVLDFINKNKDLPRYLIGHFGLSLLRKFAGYNGLFIENHKPSKDGYHGIFYRNMEENSILEEKWEFDFSRLDANCNCYTCSSGYTCSYLHHLLQNTPLLAQRLLISHNVFYINHLP